MTDYEKRIEKVKHEDFKIGIWSLDNNAFKQMKELNKKTKSTGLEHGGLLCGDREKEKILLRQKCIGTNCEISLHSKEKLCKEKEWHIGIFHTHPKTTTPILSLSDIKSFKEREFFSCLGTSNNNKVICHETLSNSDEYWKKVSEEKPIFDKMLEFENELHEKTKKGEPVINWKLSNKERNKEVKKMAELNKYRKYYQDTYLKRVELI